ncbi:MAG: GTP pyrophosphokinase family protein [Oscillospiraceae bacterium]|nr:GTP pyrophosphokinase family protein [Oscillospiraceae bacterium]
MSQQFQSERDIEKEFEQIFESEEAHYLIAKRAHEYAKLMAYYRCAIMEVETKFKVLNEEFSLRFDRNPIENIKSRLKRPISIRNKLKKYGYPLSMSNIEEHLHDVAGIRVICSFPSDVYTIAEALLSQDDIILIERKDYIKNPKPSGYRSLHLIIEIPIFLAKEKRMMKVEIQFRTIAMDCWASLEHQIHYKKDYLYTDEMAKELALCADISADLDRRMEALRKTVTQTKEKEIEDTINII